MGESNEINGNGSMGTQTFSWFEAPASWVHQFGVRSVAQNSIQNSIQTLTHCFASQSATMLATRTTVDEAGGADFGNALSDAHTQRQLRVDSVAQSCRIRSTRSSRCQLERPLGRQQLTRGLADVISLSAKATAIVVDAMRLAGN